MRLIDVDELIADIEKTIAESGCVNHEGEIMDCIRYATEVDAAPVARGEWITTETYSYAYRINLRETTCSACGKRPNIYMLKSDYCPNCGAKLEDKP